MISTVFASGATTDIAAKIEEGHQFERDFFGFSPTFDPDDANFGGKRITLHESLPEVLRRQQDLLWNPEKPNTRLAGKLLWVVKEKLPRNIRGETLLCCALGTPLDYIGIDGFFILDCNKHGPITFNLARTACRLQRRKLKANGLITIADMEHDERLRRIGSVVAQSLLRALNKRNGKTTRRRLW
jgi:hypothetical protein